MTEKKYTLVMSGNGSVIHLLPEGPVPPVVPGVFLVLDFTLGLCLNLVLVFTVITCPVLRRLSFNRILLQLGVVCALDCFLNITSAVAFVAVTHLEFSPEYATVILQACRGNAALTQWTTVIQSVALAALGVDRALMLRQQDDCKSDTRNRLMKFLPILMWVYGTALVAPIVSTSHVVDVRPFADRYSCSLVPSSEEIIELIYPSLLFVLGYIIPWVVILSTVVIIARHVVSTRRRQLQLEEAALQRSQGRSMGGIGTSTMLLHSTSYQTSWSNWFGNSGPMSWEEVKFYFLSTLLLVLYIIFLVPHILYINIPSLINIPPPITTPRPAPISSGNSIKKNNTESQQPPELTPILTGTFDCLFVWCRFIFTILVPIVIFAIHKEVRKKSEHMFCCCCCRSNAVVHLDDARSISACVEKRVQVTDQDVNNQKVKQISRKKYTTRKDKYSRIAHYRTPVLFATSEGLHLRLVDDRLEDSYYLNEPDIGEKGAAGGKEQCWTVEPRFICEFCDVAIIISTPSDVVGNPTHSLQQSFGASLRRGLKPPVFGDESFAEEDLHVSDELTGDSSSEFTSKTARKLNESQEPLVARNNVANNRNVPFNNNRKVPRVRFAQTVSEIPLSESGVWSAPEDQGLVEQSLHYKKNEASDIPLNAFKPKPKINASNRTRTDQFS